MDKEKFIEFIENMNIDTINDFKLEVEMADGTEITIKDKKD